MNKTITTFLLVIIVNFLAFGQNVDFSNGDAFFKKYVSADGQVDYKAIKENDSQLNSFLKEFSEISPKESWTKNESLAYWINAYNAFTIKLIVDNYPTKSIKDIKKPWDQDFIKIGEDHLSLNHIEHEILRKMDEPRIHFAIVCASASCPKLRNEAYVPEKLEQQLTEATKVFLSDPNRNIIKANKLEISKIFKWFDKDFEQNGSIIDFLNLYSDTKITSDAKIDYLEYSWELND